VNTGSGSISSYRIGGSGRLHLLGSTLVSSGKGAGAVDARLSTDGQTLYVNETTVGQIGEFAVDGGDLTELGSVPVSTGAGAAGVAVN
jgi:sugar lactone lactonase YvrE